MLLLPIAYYYCLLILPIAIVLLLVTIASCLVLLPIAYCYCLLPIAIAYCLLPIADAYCLLLLLIAYCLTAKKELNKHLVLYGRPGTIGLQVFFPNQLNSLISLALVYIEHNFRFKKG